MSKFYTGVEIILAGIVLFTIIYAVFFVQQTDQKCSNSERFDATSYKSIVNLNTESQNKSIPHHKARVQLMSIQDCLMCPLFKQHTWKELHKHFSGRIDFEEVNCSDERNIPWAHAQTIPGYPAIRFLSNSKDQSPALFQGVRSFERVKSFIEENLVQ